MLNTLSEIHQIFTQILIILIIFKIFGFYFIFYLERKKKSFLEEVLVHPPISENNRIDIIVAAYNEEKTIVKTINNLLKIDYKNFKIFIVNDGSTDKTLNLLNLNYENHPQLKILSKENEGKAEALSYALAFSSAEIITFIDADTHIQSDILEIVSSCFKDKQISAMSGYLKVRNPFTMLTIGQNIEYITNFNLEREVFGKIETLTTIPGAICAYRKKQLLEVGGFNNETVTEDYDVTLKLLRQNSKIKNEKKAIAYTEAPESIKMFIRQRIRWDYGLIQNLVKHKNYVRNNSFKIRLVLYYSWIYKICYTLLFAIMDYLFLILLIIGGELTNYIFFLIFETLVFMVILKKEIKMSKYKVFLFIFYRIVYRHLKFFSLAIAINKFLIGKKLQWKKIQRSDVCN